MASPNPSDERLAVAQQALVTIEATARRNAEALLSIARTARAALDQIDAIREAAQTPVESEFIDRDSEGLGNPV